MITQLTSRIESLEQENEELKTRLQTLEDNFEQMVTQVIDNYQFRTVCKYDIRGTGNINIVAASTLQD